MNLVQYVLLVTLATPLVLNQHAPQTNQLGLIKQPETVVRRLYHEVVIRHPLGIPSGANMKIFAPYLSRALLHRMELRGACEADFFRQHPRSSLLKGPGPTEIGLFAGPVDEEAEPQAFHIERTEAEKNGSFRVDVRLRLGTRPKNPGVWHVAAIVIREDEHFVVDDVIYLKDQNLDVESRLSEDLSVGCDGPLWVGYGDRTSGPH